jgi:hypothetical protein
MMALVAVPALASHPQTVSEAGASVTVQFDHDGDNEWWVEVLTRSPDQVATVEVRAETEGVWRFLRHHSASGDWQKWAPSQAFRVPPGERVQFRAAVVDQETGQQVRVESCLFTHPTGTEQCTTTPGTFDASFRGVTGNEWWIQAQVTPNTGWTVAKVEARVDGGAWKPLAKQSWGTNYWAASHQVRDFQVVQLRATSTTGITDQSDCYRWIPQPNQNAQIVACGSDPGPATWQRESFAVFFAPAYEIGVGDADRDTKDEVYVASEEALYQIERDPSGGLRTTISAEPFWITLAVGDGDNDGKQEVYATRHVSATNQYALERFSWSGSAWTQRTIMTSGEFLGAMALADVDSDGRRELYVASDAGGGTAVHQVAFRDGAWTSAKVAQFGAAASFLSPVEVWAGDADGDGRQELAIAVVGRGFGEAWVVDHGAGGWTATVVHSGAIPAGIVAGDIDGDGRGELAYAGDDGVVVRAALTGGAWSTQAIATMPATISDMALGDGDNDGKPEMYFPAFDGHLYQLEWTGSAWTQQDLGAVGEDMADLVVVGDADDDGRRNVYTASWSLEHQFTRVYDFFLAPLPSNFDAEFSGVKGNNWWVQVDVWTNEPFAGVDARVDCGIWRPLAKQNWGSWAASFHVPTGSVVDFRARAFDGATDHSGGYVWPNATPTGGC